MDQRLATPTIIATTSAEGATWKEGVVVNNERAENVRYTVLNADPAGQP